jgi:hypothetical protein
VVFDSGYDLTLRDLPVELAGSAAMEARLAA